MNDEFEEVKIDQKIEEQLFHKERIFLKNPSNLRIKFRMKNICMERVSFTGAGLLTTLHISHFRQFWHTSTFLE